MWFLLYKRGANFVVPDDAQIELGTSATDYVEHEEVVNEINLGKNLFNTNNKKTIWKTTIEEESSNNITLIPTENANAFVSYRINNIQPSTQYTFSCFINIINSVKNWKGQIYIREYNASETQHYITNISTDNLQRTFTTQSDTTTLGFDIYSCTGSETNYTNMKAIYTNIQLEKGSVATSYSPYFEPIELCKIGDYQDKIYRNNGKWYLSKRNIKIVLDGTQTPSSVSASTNTTRVSFNHYADGSSAINQCFCNQLTFARNWSSDTEGVCYDPNNGGFWFRINKTTIGTTASEVNTYLSNNNLICYIPLREPTITEITNTELIEQLENIRLLDGYNYIVSSLPIEIEYAKEVETIDEENLKDVNVNFGEHYGAINTVSFKRSESSDVITKSIPENLSDDLKVEIAIEDNQILNDNNRADYIDDILNELYGLEFYKNDFTSTGITYLELCDKYNISITKYDDNEQPYTSVYPCIMLNDEILVTQGLQENIHTDLPEQSETDYETASKDDRTRIRATLKVDKAVGEITASVSKIEDIEETIYGDYELTKDTTFQKDKTYYIYDGTDYIEFTDYEVGDTIPANTIYERDETSSLEQRLSSAEFTLREQGATLEIKTSKIDGEGNSQSFLSNGKDEDGNETEQIKYELGLEGFKIEDSKNGYKSVSDATGQYYYDNDVMVGKYTKDIAVHKDLALYGKYYYGIDDEDSSFNVDTFTKDDAMFMAQMYEAQWQDENNTTQTELGFGHFWNGD